MWPLAVETFELWCWDDLVADGVVVGSGVDGADEVAAVEVAG